MNKDTMKGSWKELSGKVKQQWAKLTDDDLTAVNGSYQELEGKLQKTYGYQKEEVKKHIADFVKKHNLEDDDEEVK
jgi:uncharacterized protein YjbJ (UPF0337 family)